MDQLTAEEYQEGKVFLFDKEKDWTSFDLVNKLRLSLRNALGIKKIKVGHTGTLDPLATGLVILCCGKATKTIESYMGLEKEYIAQITLGGTTPSFDLETEIDQTFPYDHITTELLQETLASFKGETEQMPPIYSAKQIDGKRAYDLARKGKEVKLKSSLVTIYEIELVQFNPPELIIRILCSKGTYIRSLANDIGKKLNSGAYLSDLRRTKIGDYHVNDAQNLNDFVKTLRSL